MSCGIILTFGVFTEGSSEEPSLDGRRSGQFLKKTETLYKGGRGSWHRGRQMLPVWLLMAFPPCSFLGNKLRSS